MIQRKLVEKLAGYTAPDELKNAGIYPYFRPIGENKDTEIVIQGKKLLMFGSNSYMGLTNHPKVTAAAKQAIDKYGSSCSGSRFLNGTSRLHIRLEERLADFVGKEAALVFTTGFQANLGTVASLTGRNGVLILDEADHASIIEGSRLSFSRVLKFAHNDMNDLERILRAVEGEGIRMIVVDGIFSMEGDICKLPEIAALAAKYEALLMVDDAHSIGVLGESGRGTADHFGLTDQVDIIMGTFSKSLASVGGFVASTREMINYLKHHSRALIFSASIPPSAAAAAMAALEIIQAEPERQEALRDNTAYMAKMLDQLGFDTHCSMTPIIPIYIRDNRLTFEFTQRLFDRGIFVNPVVSPAVRSDAAMVRMSVMATHTRRQLDMALSALEKVSRELQLFGIKQA
ncbi:aminotransferase class I/II-fold pyridoxal phosphate-dependent enzyme [Asinibacterium sp. OR53]|uniref:serine palmitoyltransferase n=1 Tax=Asinibacterium sp. OR53 TaxID=925409 RepID=UPI0004AF0DF1|nr:aminotransferase class I/II-fold pyridoxal phosphate-dependent enzyme [Asinibacterium sp. OR53]